MRTAVVGHVEWVTFGRVDHVPGPGEIVHAEDVFDVPAGGGAVAAVQLMKLAGHCTFYTAFGDDDLGHRARVELEEMGVHVEAIDRPEEQRRAFTHVDNEGERTITVIGERLGPLGSDPLPWDELHEIDAVYFCAGDDYALERTRRARTVVATTREAERLARVRVYLDAVVGSGRDPSETYVPIDPEPGIIVETLGADGGWYRAPNREGTFAAAPLPGPRICAYGAGDSFAAGLTYALGAGYDIENALRVASRCGAAVATGCGPYEAQLTADDL